MSEQVPPVTRHEGRPRLAGKRSTYVALDATTRSTARSVSEPGNISSEDATRGERGSLASTTTTPRVTETYAVRPTTAMLFGVAESDASPRGSGDRGSPTSKTCTD